ncbi:hypothetical protein [Vreelandella zhaodongensis]|uniref:ATP-grasp domain-containing protein n=1 Tax=Vreelandella zhaodongensis TaxID=1176240 RepID=A0ABX2SMK8_VREZH|nr:hypothetical protein [Halomonas zhaodongensis]NYS43403.1 hypothetical protein [Halomonas zhaodongensis]
MASEKAVYPIHVSPKIVKQGFGYKLCGFLIALEAWRRGLTVKLEDASFKRYSISDNNTEVRFIRSRSSLTKNKAIVITKNKQLTREYLQAAGVPTPAGKLFESCNLKDIEKFASEIGFPVVLKPLDGSLGNGVVTDISGSESLAEAFDYVHNKLGFKKLVLEKQVWGDDFRAFVIAGRVASVVKRVPANVVGDGKSTISELIDQKNAERKLNPFLSTGLIKKDEEVNRYVEKNGFTMSSVILQGEKLRLRGKANASAGADVIDVTDSIPEFAKDAAVRAVSCIPDLAYCGVDVMYDEATNSCHIIELNAQSQIGVNIYPSEGEGKDLARAIVDTCFPNSPYIKNKFDSKLVFDTSSLSKAFMSHSVEKIVLRKPSLANLKKIKRSYCVFSTSDVLLKKKISVLLKDHNVDGFISKKDNDFQLMVSGDVKEVESFFGKFFDSLSEVNLMFTKRWVGLVKSGFFINLS